MLPMPTLGMHTLVYLTFVAALAVATVRALRPTGETTPDRALTGALAFIAVFGLGSGTYYAGRSHPEVLVTSFAAWSFALALLTLRRRAAARRAAPARWPEPAVALCLLAFCVAACSLAQTPTPWSQVDRLRATGEPLLRSAARAGVRRRARADPASASRSCSSSATASRENVGVTNVSPYTTAFATPAVAQLDDVVRALRAEGGRKVFVPTTPSAITGRAPRARRRRLRAESPKTAKATSCGSTARPGADARERAVARRGAHARRSTDSSESPAGSVRRPRSSQRRLELHRQLQHRRHPRRRQLDVGAVPAVLGLVRDVAVAVRRSASRWRTRCSSRTAAAGGSSSELKYVMRSIVQPVSAASARIILRS